MEKEKMFLECRVKSGKTDHEKAIRSTMFEIKQFNRILDKFATEDGFDEFCELDTIEISVGQDSASTYFAPQTWEATEKFIMYIICHLIESNELDKFPYYDDMIERYSKALGIKRGNFE